MNTHAMTKRAYTAYRQEVNTYGLPSYDKQDDDVKNAWLMAIATFALAGESTGHELYNRYYEAVDGVALRNNQVRLSPFDELPRIVQAGWCNAANAIY